MKLYIDTFDSLEHRVEIIITTDMCNKNGRVADISELKCMTYSATKPFKGLKAISLENLCSQIHSQIRFYIDTLYENQHCGEVIVRLWKDEYTYVEV